MFTPQEYVWPFYNIMHKRVNSFTNKWIRLDNPCHKNYFGEDVLELQKSMTLVANLKRKAQKVFLIFSPVPSIFGWRVYKNTTSITIGHIPGFTFIIFHFTGVFLNTDFGKKTRIFFILYEFVGKLFLWRIFLAYCFFPTISQDAPTNVHLRTENWYSLILANLIKTLSFKQNCL